MGLGAVAAGARHLPDEAFLAAAEAIAEHTAGGEEAEALYPPLRQLRAVTGVVASRVARTLVELGAAPPREGDELDARITALRWHPSYLPYREGRQVRPGMGVRGG